MYEYLAHHGIKGMKWGVRRYRNKDGSLTAAGKKRYADGSLTPAGYKRVSNKEIKEDRKKFREIASKNLSDTAQDARIRQNEAERKALALLDKYHFDADDGGGGITDADRRAGARYMELWDEYERLGSVVADEIGEKATAMLMQKYGEKRMKQFKTAENVKAGAAVVGILAAAPVMFAGGTIVLAGAGAVGVGALAVSSIKNKRKEKNQRPVTETKK